jgi:hypothetical protein
MRKFLLVLLLLVGSVQAADPVLVEGLTQGDYHLKVDAAGKVTIRPLQVIRVTAGPTDPSDPPTAPNPEFAEAVRLLTKEALSNGGTKTTGAAISSLYSLVADAVEAGSIELTGQMSWSVALKDGTNKILTLQADKAKWADFRTDLGDALTEIAATGKLDTKAEVADALRSIAAGMNAATGFSGQTNARILGGGKVLEGIDIAKLIELLKMILELLKLFGA